MTQRISIICHREAGGGKASQVLKEVERILTEYKVHYLVYPTDYINQAPLLAKQIASSYKADSQRVVVIGGDGTLHQVVSTFYNLQIKIPICYIKAGTGNDFSRAWQKDIKTVRQAVDRILFAHQAKELPIFTYRESVSGTRGIILNSLGIGFDAEVNYASSKQAFKPFLTNHNLGSLSYLLAIFTSFKKLKDFQVTAQIDNQIITQPHCVIACALNNPYFGGGIQLDQEVQADKAEIVLTLIHHINFWAVVELIWRILVTKTPNQSKHVSNFKGQTLSLSVDQPLRSQTDGEDQSVIQSHYQLAIDHYPFYL
ncbi:diacylglycerol/lipid kinase family protein [Vaginisenegalia massiliensis]|uniref:diacylglycerol/lipid kinase family protein n=1 Tax=Vaginisenegalia massiliensis TaxID=2058294 RepID=UPI000F52C869|nr:diacylglycerol kinase family protein [Vaginisenegalia massiliensis]